MCFCVHENIHIYIYTDTYVKWYTSPLYSMYIYVLSQELVCGEGWWSTILCVSSSDNPFRRGFLITNQRLIDITLGYNSYIVILNLEWTNNQFRINTPFTVANFQKLSQLWVPSHWLPPPLFSHIPAPRLHIGIGMPHNLATPSASWQHLPMVLTDRGCRQHGLNREDWFGCFPKLG